MNRRLGTVLSLIAVAALSLQSCSSDDEGAKTLRMHGDLPESFWITTEVQGFVDDVNGDDAAAADVKFYPSSALGIAPDQILQPLSTGKVGLAQVTVGYISGSAPYLGVAELPMLTPTTEDARAVMDATMPIVSERLAEDFDVRVLGYGVSTPVHLFLGKHKYDGIDSISGLQLRTATPVADPWISALGASSQSIAAPDLPEAIATSQVDGAFNSLSGNVALGLNEWGSNVVLTRSNVAPFLLLIGEKTWDSMSSEQQEALQKHGDELTDAWFEGAVSQEEQGIKDSEAAGFDLIEPSEADLEQMRSLAEPVWEKWAEDVEGGREILDTAIAALQ